MIEWDSPTTGKDLHKRQTKPSPPLNIPGPELSRESDPRHRHREPLPQRFSHFPVIPWHNNSDLTLVIRFIPSLTSQLYIRPFLVLFSSIFSLLKGLEFRRPSRKEKIKGTGVLPCSGLLSFNIRSLTFFDIKEEHETHGEDLCLLSLVRYKSELLRQESWLLSFEYCDPFLPQFYRLKLRSGRLNDKYPVMCLINEDLVKRIYVLLPLLSRLRYLKVTTNFFHHVYFLKIVIRTFWHL